MVKIKSFFLIRVVCPMETGRTDGRRQDGGKSPLIKMRLETIFDICIGVFAQGITILILDPPMAGAST